MEDVFIINGGKPLKGEVSLSGAKNVALKVIIASLLFNNKVVLNNVPQINDVHELIHLLQQLGVTISFTDKNRVEINTSTIKYNKVDLLHASKIRASFMLFAPLLHLFKTCFVPNPGGCRIGARPIDRIIKGMEALGVVIEYDSDTGYYQAVLRDGVSGEFIFEKPSHTGTELLIMLSVFSKRKVILKNSALEPEVDELIRFLNEGGAKIIRNNDEIVIEGVSQLSQSKPFNIVSDRNEAVTFAIAAVATKGEIKINNIPKGHLNTFIKELKGSGSGVEILGEAVIKFYYQGEIKPTNIETFRHPGFMTDWQPNWAVLMTQAKGESIIHERVFENRFSYVDELKKLGAKIDFISSDIANPSDHYLFSYNPKKNYQQTIKIWGPTKLHNGVLTILDLRAGASLVIAALVAQGNSIIQGASIVDRGYENIEEKIIKLGGEISKN